MALLNVLNCDVECTTCIKDYVKKHGLGRGGKFVVPCTGIPKEYISEQVSMGLDIGDISPEALLDPVKWASEVLDWHCWDPDGEIWARKDPDEFAAIRALDPERPSKYHRPYQRAMLGCTSIRKVFRCGRQIGKTAVLGIAMLFHMFTHPNFKIVLITPYQSQIELIFKNLEEHIRHSPYLANSIKRNVKAPNYQLELHNGSLIKGFTAGTKSGGGAGAARGSSANMLVFDEADYLDKADMDAALSIITNFPNATVWMSSTPSGKREKYYETCLSKGWKEFYYPSYVNPNWSTQLDNDFRTILTEIGYKHEVLAEFGEQEEGVFQVPHVEAAQVKYEYTDHPAPAPTWHYAIGVDWNDTKVGTTICVMGFNPNTNKFRLVERARVSRAGWTQLSACQEIVQLNRKWRPFAIYVDKGFGSTQVEVLHKLGYDARTNPELGVHHPDAKLPSVVKAYDFGSKLETRDPFTKQKIKKPAKGFLVENAVRRFESGDIQIPLSDDELKAELLNYIIKNVSPTGQIVYGVNSEEIGDHNLDAFMLSLVAFTLEKSAFGKPVMTESIQFSLPEKEDEGWVPVNQEKELNYRELRQYSDPRNKGETKRTTVNNGDDRPVNNHDTPRQVQLWAWPGWEYDKPKPVIKKQLPMARPSRGSFGRGNRGPGKGRSDF